MTSHPESDPLPIRSLGMNPPDGYPSASLLARAQLGWNAFLARSGPLPGEDKEVEHSRTDKEIKR
ncbi:hypothetical protein ACFYXM_20405 [Streptomyces sp. NPDC002476]|uniref:hypothetical protein n=1 Tax=Streptomyces sp. NPDC002476 TaxID=3364648 RepID=UPI0036CD87DC